MLGASQKISKSSPDRRPERGENAGSSVMQPDSAQIKQLLTGPEGRALLQILQADGGAGLQAAAEAMQAGNLEGAKAALSPLLAGTEAEALTQRLERKL